MTAEIKYPESIKLGNNVNLAEGVILERNVVIGNNVTIYPRVTVGSGTRIFDGAVIGRAPMATGNITRKIDTGYHPLTIGEGSIIGANTVIYTGINIGKRVLIGDLSTIREGCTFADSVVIGRGVIVMYDTSVGERTRVIDGTILTGNMVIESDVFIGPGVKTTNDNSPYLARYGLQPLMIKGPRIRRFALIGTGANINSCVEIGEGSIVAPQSMVTRDVEPWTVVGGVPAIKLKDVSFEAKRQILIHFGLKN